MKNIHKAYRRILYVILILIIAVWLSFYGQRKAGTADTAEARLGTVLGKSETIIDSAGDDTVIYALVSRKDTSGVRIFFTVFDRTGDGDWVRSYENDFTSRKPWKLEAADIDGDGKTEILTAVKKATTFDPEEKNRLFVFEYDGTKLYKQWTGSQIAGTWNNFYAEDLVDIPGKELIFIEQTQDQEEKISVYYWFDFGFFELASSDCFEDIISISVTGENHLEVTYKEKDQLNTIKMMLKDGKLIKQG